MAPDERPRFHLAFPVHDLEAARAFYGGVLGCPEGRAAPDWVDFDLFGHQIVAHLVESSERTPLRPRRSIRPTVWTATTCPSPTSGCSSTRRRGVRWPIV